MTAPIFSTLGCRLNAYETEAMKELAAAAGVANAVVVNTCAVTAEAVRKAKQEIRRLARENPGAPVIVTGCAAQTEPETFAAMPEVTKVVGNTEKMQAETWTKLRVPDLIGTTEKVQVDDIMSVKETAGHLIDGFGRHRAYVQVQNGCDHRCTFCIIPSMRGDLVSRPIGEVMREAEALVGAGVQELLVVSQDTSAYGVDVKYRPGFWSGRPLKTRMTELAGALGSLGAWVRLHYVYPYPSVDDVIPLMADGIILPYLDIPFQHASPRILKLMKRPGAVEKTLDRIQSWRAAVPDLTLRSTFIVGFPG
ncbi:MAG TPA: 30S ribosomal protein S12 methylthiotransferase RimO, partial [Gemmobacter sp.]|nr:30S ribosomal protein S12 methylthiotransferase RimO [Gemmobacter sp.]